MLHRAFNICSNFHLLHHEFLFLPNFFVQNSFPELLVQSKINKFLNSKYERGQTVENFFISLPYFGLQVEKLKLELTSLLNKYFENITFKIVLGNKQIICWLFQYKDTLDKGIASAVVYKYCCPKCGAHYVGSTCRGWTLALLSMPESVLVLVFPYPTLHLLISESIHILVVILGSTCFNLISLVGVAILSI